VKFVSRAAKGYSLNAGFALKAAGDVTGSLPPRSLQGAKPWPSEAMTLGPAGAKDGINRQKKALIVGADIPHMWHAQPNLKYLGTVVHKMLQVFNAGRTVTMAEDGHLVRQLNR